MICFVLDTRVLKSIGYTAFCFYNVVFQFVPGSLVVLHEGGMEPFLCGVLCFAEFLCYIRVIQQGEEGGRGGGGRGGRERRERGEEGGKGRRERREFMISSSEGMYWNLQIKDTLGPVILST